MAGLLSVGKNWFKDGSGVCVLHSVQDTDSSINASFSIPQVCISLR